jgi:ribokinase
MTERRRERIVVIGSSNMDLVVRAPRLPGPGETLAGHDFRTLPGGKGANQAVAAARLGGRVSFVSCVGDDAFGAELKAACAADGIDVDAMRVVEGEATGIACITVADDGANSIVLSAGSNARLAPDVVDSCEALIADAAVLVLQLEIPLPSVQRAIEIASRHATTVILNPAPAAPLPPALLAQVDVLVPNETEAGLLCGFAVTGVESARRAADALREQGAHSVIVTLGGEGVWFAGPRGEGHVPALKVTTVDTTAAGDTFIGALAVELAAGAQMRDAIAFGIRAAALSVTRIGAQASIPHRADVDAIDVHPRRHA